MDVAPNTDLEDFLNGIEEKEDETVKETTVWEDIFSALHSWKQSFVDVESLFEKTGDFQRGIEAIIHRQELEQDAKELRFVADLWTKLLNNITSYSLGCVFAKGEIIRIKKSIIRITK